MSCQCARRHRAEEWELAYHIVGSVMLDGKLAGRLLDDAGAPCLEDVEPDAARPGGLDLPDRADLPAGGDRRRAGGDAGRKQSGAAERSAGAGGKADSGASHDGPPVRTRKRGGWGKSVPVRVVVGGRRGSKKTNKRNKKN